MMYGWNNNNELFLLIEWRKKKVMRFNIAVENLTRKNRKAMRLKNHTDL